jgi:hypothetical protein
MSRSQGLLVAESCRGQALSCQLGRCHEILQKELFLPYFIRNQTEAQREDGQGTSRAGVCVLVVVLEEREQPVWEGALCQS